VSGDREQPTELELDLIRHAWRSKLVAHLHALKLRRRGVRHGERDCLERAGFLARRLRRTGTTLGMSEVSDAAEAFIEAAAATRAEAYDQLIHEVRWASIRQSRQGTIWVAHPSSRERDGLSALLATKGRRIVGFADLEALRLHHERDASQVVLGVISSRLPGAREAIRLLDGTHVPSVFLAAEPGHDDVLLLGAVEIVRDPVDPDDLLQAVGPRVGRHSQVALQLQGDVVTGLADRESMEQATRARADRDERWTLGLLKIVGADSAEAALRDLARALESRFEAYQSTCGRWAEDTLAVAGTMDAGAFDAAINAVRMSLDGTYRIHIGAAIGAGHDAQAVVSAAETSLKQAASGRLKVVERLPAVRREQVLVVDDDPALRAAMVLILRPLGVRVITCNSGLEALQITLDQVFDVILLDLVMVEGPDGLEVLEVLRKRRALTDTPIVLLTSVDGDAERIVAYERGADDYLNKPIRPAVLRARVRGLLERRRLRR